MLEACSKHVQTIEIIQLQTNHLVRQNSTLQNISDFPQDTANLRMTILPSAYKAP